jgi:hypothetical protein
VALERLYLLYTLFNNAVLGAVRAWNIWHRLESWARLVS